VYRFTFLVALLAASAGAAPVPKDDDAARMARTSGAKSDPAGDAQFELTRDALWIRVPKRELPTRAHRLSTDMPELDAARAPQLCREVQGDFTATVRVTFPLVFAKAKTDRGIRGAGLIVWVSKTEYVTLARTEWVHSAAREVFHLTFRDGDASTGEADNQDRVAGAGFIRLTRRGPRLSGSYSRDEKQWTEFILTKPLPGSEPVKVGVFATHVSDTPFEVMFDGYTLTVPKK
jgi:regulation of enolase protein 1 (concanavalin A-like superfamily)